MKTPETIQKELAAHRGNTESLAGQIAELERQIDAAMQRLNGMRVQKQGHDVAIATLEFVLSDETPAQTGEA